MLQFTPAMCSSRIVFLGVDELQLVAFARTIFQTSRFEYYLSRDNNGARGRWSPIRVSLNNVVYENLTMKEYKPIEVSVFYDALYDAMSAVNFSISNITFRDIISHEVKLLGPCP